MEDASKDKCNAAPRLLEVRDLQVEFETDGGIIRAVDGVSLSVPRGRTVAIVGESGCGKSVTALSIMRLIPQPPGRVAGERMLFYDIDRGSTTPSPIAVGGSIDLLQLSTREMCKIRGNRIAMVFQEPTTSLNPVLTIGEQIVEAIELHQALDGRAAKNAAVDMLRRVGIEAPAQRIREYPHQLSGGMLQRVMIAMALSCKPALLIADEPTTALDVTIQAQILALLRDLQAELGMSILMITHDLSVVAEVADYVYVMYAGRIVEQAPIDLLYAKPMHPYTQGLMRCLPSLAARQQRLETIAGSVPDPSRYPKGCRFHPRCRLSAERAEGNDRASVRVGSEQDGLVLRRCVESYEDEPSGQPPLREVGRDHFVACWEADAAL
jgi:oligopeptide/dipeptide ABC transporter ATP-binding protein